MVGSATVDRYLTRRNERVNYILRVPEKRHRFGISSLAVGNELFTAGRDGTVRTWPLPDTKPVLNKVRCNASVPTATTKATKTFDEHVDWVNDVILVPGHDRLVSASSDTTLKVWNIADPSRSLRTLVEHSDYVKALAHVPNGGVASGSLDGRVLVWDLVTGRVQGECAVEGDDGGRNGSVYCMSGSLEERLLVSGSTDKTISVWDIRTGERRVHLRGHSDSVRCLAIKSDGKYMLSGATDSVVKLWDLRQESCLRSFDSYGPSSIWAIAANKTFDSFVSGGRDGSVWYTDMKENRETLVVPPADRELRSNMVLDLALNPCKTAVWVSTTGSTVRLWPLPSHAHGDPSDMQDCPVLGRDEAKASRSGRPFSRPQQDRGGLPLYTIPGLPGIIAHRVMNDRRHVMTCDTEGEYSIWDITRGVLEKSLGIIQGVDIDEVLKKYDTEVSVPSWFQVEIRLGSLSVRLDKGTVANAEIYAIDAGLEVESEDVKVNIGEHVVRGLFGKWKEEHRRRTTDNPDADNNHVGNPRPSPKTPGQRSVSELPPYTIPNHIAVVVTEDRSPVPILRKHVGDFLGKEETLMPSWVIDLVRDGKGQTRDSVKISFTLEPADDSGLPPLGTTSLNAPKVLRVRKVTAYVARELKEIRTGLDFEIEEDHLEILCNGQALPPTMSLATVRQFRWRSPEELHLQFRLKDKV